MKEKWNKKPVCGKFPSHLDNEYLVVEQSFQWMKHYWLKGKMEGLIVGSQDQALNTRYYCKHIMKQGLTDKCRICHSQPETLEQIISWCQTLVAEKYLNRYNLLAAQLHLDICKYCDTQLDAQYWYEHKPGRVLENVWVTVLWDSQIITDMHIPCTKPDIVIKEKVIDKCPVIDVAIASDYNIQKRATKEMSKYMNIQIECQECGTRKLNSSGIQVHFKGSNVIPTLLMAPKDKDNICQKVE